MSDQIDECLRHNWGREFENGAILAAIEVNEDGYWEVLDAAEGMKKEKSRWVVFSGSVAVDWMVWNSSLVTNALVCWKLWAKCFLWLNANGVQSTFNGMFSPLHRAFQGKAGG